MMIVSPPNPVDQKKWVMADWWLPTNEETLLDNSSRNARTLFQVPLSMYRRKKPAANQICCFRNPPRQSNQEHRQSACNKSSVFCALPETYLIPAWYLLDTLLCFDRYTISVYAPPCTWMGQAAVFLMMIFGREAFEEWENSVYKGLAWAYKCPARLPLCCRLQPP